MVFIDETKECFGLLIGQHVSVVVVSTRLVSVRYRETGKKPAA